MRTLFKVLGLFMGGALLLLIGCIIRDMFGGGHGRRSHDH